MQRRSRTPVFRGALIAAMAATVLVTAACEGDEDQIGLADDATPSPAPTTPTPQRTPTPTPTPASDGADDDDGGGQSADEDDGEAFEGDTEDVELDGAANQQTAVLDEVRIGRHDGFDRVVWEFRTGDRPRLWVEYVDEPSEPGSGEPVEVAGATAIQVTASTATDYGAEVYAPDHQPYDGPERVQGPRTERVTEAVALGDFEATMQWAVGVDAERPFRVEVLEDPLRVVLDVRH